MIDPSEITDSWLRAETDPGSFARGRQYFDEGNAHLDEIMAPEKQALILNGACSGSQPYPYHQNVEILRSRGELDLIGECTCPVGFNCKHVIALVLAWRAKMQRDPVNAPSIEQWLEELDHLSPPAGDATPETTDAAESLFYILEPLTDGYEVDFRIARRKKNGEWGKGRQVSLEYLNDPWGRPRYIAEEDDAILELISVTNHLGWTDIYSMHDTPGYLALGKIVNTGRAFLEDTRDAPLRAGEPRALNPRWERSGDQYHLVLDLGDDTAPMLLDPPCYLDRDQRTVGLLQLPKGLGASGLDWLRRAPAVEATQAEAISRRLALRAPTLPTPAEVVEEDINEAPRPILAVDFEPRLPTHASAELEFSYAGLRVRQSDPRDAVVGEHDERLIRARRDYDAEARAIQQLNDSGLHLTHGDQFGVSGRLDRDQTRDAWLHWWEIEAPALEREGWTIERSSSSTFRLSQADGIDGEVEAGDSDWFNLRFDLEFEGWRMPLLPLITPLLEHYRPGSLPEKLYLDAGQGHFVSVPAEQIEPVLTTIVELFDRLGGEGVRLSRPDATRLLDLDGIPVRGATHLQQLARKLADFSGLKQTRLPTTFKGKLREYQQHGVDWMQFLREHELGGILADDMGLGKTVQTLAHLAVEKRAGRMRDPSLVVAPTSLMGNWRREAEIFTPGLNVLVLHGPNRSDDFEHLSEYDLVLSTYPLLPRDREALLKQRWHYLILDEAQQIKNPRAQAAQVARALNAGHRLCLTGTPMENHLGELWAQFDFLMPEFLGDREHFTRTYRTPVEKHNDGERLQALTRRTAPFLLRRTKERVASELPPKTELLRTTSFEAKQARLYESIRLTMEKKVRQAVSARGLARSHIVVLDALLKLRQVCCDPRLLPKGTSGARGTPSAKFELLFDLLPELLDEGRRVLLFSQFTTMLGLIESEVKKRGLAYTKLTGQTRKRDQAIARFRDGDVNLFLISLKAGGVGLNLVEADTVIHYDPWWNPATEHQATDRAHRIGQDKPVFVYKLVTEGTVEEKIVELQQRKQKLADNVYGKGRDSDQPPIDEDTIQALLAS